MFCFLNFIAFNIITIFLNSDCDRRLALKRGVKIINKFEVVDLSHSLLQLFDCISSIIGKQYILKRMTFDSLICGKYC